MDPAAAKQQIAERVKQANKFLVTVSANPTVDQLAACIGLTLLLNKMGKHATAVFSGKVPNVLEFLQPEKTIETNTDSLRDFIISLDKNKADKLRYKVEDSVVRIFITPYRTSLSEKDLEFSEGDFNVEVVIALGVTQRAQLDAAITAHGRILHDATVISVNPGSAAKAPDIGQINWQDGQASSLCEMLVSISEAFGPGLLDAQMATAFLTGIVAETGRFANKKTSPKVMTMSAQLMAAGANQQLIVSKLEPPPPPPKQPPPPPAPPPKPPVPKPPKQPPLKPEGVLDVAHDNKKQDEKEVEVEPTEIHIDEQGNITTTKQLAPVALPPAVPPPPVDIAPLPKLASTPPPPAAAPALPNTQDEGDPSEMRNTHDYLSPTQSSSLPSSFSAPGQPDWAAPYDLVPADPMDKAAGEGISSHGHNVQPPAVDNARNAVQSALNSAPFDPVAAGPVQALNAQPIEVEPPPSQAPGDTPSLTLPVGDSLSLPPKSMPGVDPAAPPPLPPPLMTGPGAVVPNLPHEY